MKEREGIPQSLGGSEEGHSLPDGNFSPSDGRYLV
jgi:hypothetical protein